MIKLRKPNSKFYRWWNSYSGRRIVSAAYSLGAAIVIMGAMFKILHLPAGNIMLGVGMTVESFIFALGIFDRPFREYDWSKIFNFKPEDGKLLDANTITSAVSGGVKTAFAPPEGGEVYEGGTGAGHGFGGGGYGGGGTVIIGGGGGVATSGEGFDGEITISGGAPSGGLLFGDSLSEEDVQKLSEGIKNLTLTAEHLQTLANVALAANGFAEKIESASEMAESFADTQQKLNDTAATLASSYRQVNSEMDTVMSSTRNYSGNVEGMSSSITAISSLYEIQLKHLQEQAEAIRRATEQVNGVATDMDKMKVAASAAESESQRYQAATRRLTQQVEDLNAIYGNMLNALS